MAKNWKSLSPEDFKENPFTAIGKDWMLVTAGTIEQWNTMTAAWGGLGYLWNREAAFAFVRPNRYTYGFMEKNDHYTLSFFPPEQRRMLNFCGTHSGRDTDKAKETGITPFSPTGATISFEEARLILICKKIYTQDLDPRFFLDPAIHDAYPEKQYHRMYVGEVAEILTAE